MEPIIGITECYNSENYVYAIEKHGGRVKELFIRDNRAAEKIVADLDGLLLPGGGDIDPRRYNESRYHVKGISKIKGVSRSRDTSELQLCLKALEVDIPVFGICRGIQILNVATGGSLYQDIHTQLNNCLLHKDEQSKYDAWHNIKIQPGSLLNQFTDDSFTEVNSAHHQAVKTIGEGLIVTAQSEDGIIEAIEYPAKPFVIAVQYHPERMGNKYTSPYPNGGFLKHAIKLFEAFINAATERRKTC